MQDIYGLITNFLGPETEAFTPVFVVSVMVLCLGLETISNIVYAVLSSTGMRGR